MERKKSGPNVADGNVAMRTKIAGRLECASLDLSKILHTPNLASFPQGSNTYVIKFVIIAFAWEYGFQCTILNFLNAVREIFR